MVTLSRRVLCPLPMLIARLTYSLLHPMISLSFTPKCSRIFFDPKFTNKNEIDLCFKWHSPNIHIFTKMYMIISV